MRTIVSAKRRGLSVGLHLTVKWVKHVHLSDKQPQAVYVGPKGLPVVTQAARQGQTSDRTA